MGFFSPFHWIVLSWVMGGAGIPLGMPPLPEDPIMAQIAPEECLLYMTSAGVATPDPKSANQTEQLLAEPEVQAMVADIERAIRAGMAKSMGRGLPPGASSEGLADMVKVVLTRPLAIYVSGVQIQPRGSIVRGGLAVNCGDNVANLKAQIEKLVKDLPSQGLEVIEIGGERWLRIQPTPEVTIAWGFRDKYFFVGVGEGELEAMLKRTGNDSPRWLAQVRGQIPVERMSTVTFLNLKAIKSVALPMAGPQVANTIQALGFDNVTALTSVTGLDTKGCVHKTFLSIDGELEGLLRLASVEPLTPKDLDSIPQDATLAIAFKLSTEDAFNTIQEIMAKIDVGAKEQMIRELGRFGEQTGVNLQDDILKPLGDTWCLYDSPSEGGLLTGLTLVVPLREAKQAAATEAKLLKLAESIQAANPGANGVTRLPGPRIDKIEFADQRISVLDLGKRDAMVAPSWCVTDKELIVALYPQSIKAYLSRSADFKSLAQMPEVAEALEGDVGPLKIAYCDTQRVFDLLYPIATVAAQAMAREMRRGGIEIGCEILPSAGAVRKHLSPAVMSVRRTKAGIEILEQHSLPSGGMASAAPIGIGMLLPAVQAAQSAARRVASMDTLKAAVDRPRIQSMNNMKQIVLAMHNYAQANKTFPPAYTVDKEGKPLLSWRVLILPYLEQDGLYKQFHLDEPWDSEHNRKLVVNMPAFYKNSASKVAGEGKTNYLTIRGENTIFPGKKGIGFGEILDGTSNTILTVEAADAKAVIWTKPDDFEFDADNPLKGLVGLQPGGFNAGMADGSVRFMPASIDPKTARLLFLRNDREAVDWNRINP
jgi:hypothetical protein